MRSITKLCVLAATLLLVFTVTSCKLLNQLKAREHLNQGVKAYTAKKYDEAVEEFKVAIENDSELVDAYLYLAAAYRAQFVPLATSPENLRKGQEAIATFEQVLELDPQSTNAMANIADLHRNMSEPEKAKEWYRKLMEISEEKAQALYGIAAIDYNLANDKTGSDGENVENLTEEELAEVNRVVEEGMDALRQALEIRPDYTDAMEYLNLLYREKGELATDDEERRRWQNEADRLALDALEMKRKLQREVERARRQMFIKAEEESKAEGESPE